MHKAIYILILILLLPMAEMIHPALAQRAPETGICEGEICGPSGSFTVDTIPTVIDIDWEAFPENPSRPYSPAPGGRIWYVSPEGDDEADGTLEAPLRNVERAAVLAQTGDVILVADGEYPVGVYEDTIMLDTPGVILAAEHVGGATLRPLSDDWAWLAGVNAAADDLVIDGFVIRGFTNGPGVFFGRLNGPQRNLVLRHLWIEGVSDGIRSAIPIGETEPHPLVDGMLVYDVAIRDTLIGFNCGEGPCNSVRLEALSIVMPGGDTGSWGDGIAVESGDNIVVFNAEISGAGADGIDLKSTRSLSANVYVHDVGRNAIKYWHDGDIINALVAYADADASIVMGAEGRYRILNTVVARHNYRNRVSAYVGTIGYDEPAVPAELEIINSIFYQNMSGFWVSGAIDLDVRNCLFFGSANGLHLIWALPSGEVVVAEPDMPFANLEAAGGGCCNLGFVDPMFADPDEMDFHLMPGSPAIDAGTTDVEAFPDFDLTGGPRVIGNGVDLGPLEAGQ